MAKEYIDKNLTWKALDAAHLFDNGNPRHIAQQVIEEQPTADVVEVDKVIKELEREFDWARTHGANISHRLGRTSGLATAIRIVKDVAKMDVKKVE